MSSRMVLYLLLLVPALCFGANREMQELQRDVALLQQQVRDLQRSQDDKLGEMRAILNQTLDAAQKTATALAVLESGMRDRMRDQEKSVAAPVASLGAKVDTMANEFGGLRDSIADLTARFGKLQQQLVDLSSAVRTMQTPPAPPPGAVPLGGAPSGPGASGGPVPSAQDLYQTALRDRQGGKLDLALQEFNDYLKYYSNTDLAPNAQFYLGDIHYSQGSYTQAVSEFDAVLEKFSDNEKTDDALYMKGMSLVRMGQKTKGAQEFRELIRRFPRSDLAAKAREQLKALGLSAGVSTPARSIPARRGRR